MPSAASHYGDPSGNVVLLHDGHSQGMRRILLIAAAFPPSSAVGGLRWEKFSRHLHDSGFALDVVTMHPDEAESVDLSRLNDLPSSMRVYGVRSARTFPLRASAALHVARARTLRPVRESSSTSVEDPPARGRARSGGDANGIAGIVRTSTMPALPRNRAEWGRAYRGWLSRQQENAWATAAARVALTLGERESFAAVISSGPPNQPHVVAAKIAGRINKPFLMDMRDPWGTAVAIPTEHASPFEVRYARRNESFCVARAAGVLVNTPLAKDLLLAAYPGVAHRCHVVMNGVDSDVATGPAERSRFVIVFAGSIYLDRNPRLVFRAAARVIKELELKPTEFGFELIGSVEAFGGSTTSAIATEEGISEFVTLRSFIPRAQLLERLRSATMLLSLPQDVETSIPAKIFEYMAFPAWLLVLATQDSATASLLKGTDADVVEPFDVEAMSDRIKQRVLEFRRGEIPRPVGANERFGRQAQARVLLAVLATAISAAENDSSRRRASAGAPG